MPPSVKFIRVQVEKARLGPQVSVRTCLDRHLAFHSQAAFGDPSEKMVVPTKQTPTTVPTHPVVAGAGSAGRSGAVLRTADHGSIGRVALIANKRIH